MLTERTSLEINLIVSCGSLMEQGQTQDSHGIKEKGGKNQTMQIGDSIQCSIAEITDV